MSAKTKNLSKHSKLSLANLHADKIRVGIVVSDYHNNITYALRDGAIATLKQYGIREKNIFVEWAPGAYELPLAAKWLYEKKKLDAVLALGCVIKGDTAHDIYINTAVSQALMNLSLKTGTPFLFGVITPNTLQQAKDRAGGKHGNKGVECAVAALKMLELKNK